MSAIANPFLQNNFAPIRQECDVENLTVIGEIPPELSGMLVRNGPNPQFDPIGQYHWFDGDGMLHGVHLHEGKATYRNRYVQTEGFHQEREAQQAIWSGLLEPPQMELPGGPTKNTSNTALVWHSQRLLTLMEAAEPYAIALPSLDTCGSYTFEGKLQSPVTAHPKVDPETGEMMLFSYSFMPPYLQYGVVSAAGELLRMVPIDLEVGVMMHDCAITEQFTIFLDFPLTFRPERAAQGIPLAFERDRPSRFGIIPRHGDNSQIRWFEAATCFAFHVLNAYEDGDEVVLIACPRAEYDLTGLVTDVDASTPRFHEWRFNLGDGTVQERRLCEIPVEFPRINEQYMGRCTRYGFASRIADNPMPLFDGVVKLDFATPGLPAVQVHELGRDRYCGEAMFAPHPEPTAEDDGWLLTFVQDEAEDQAELLILDARDLDRDPVARVLLPQRVPYGFHGLWVSDAQIQATRSEL